MTSIQNLFLSNAAFALCSAFYLAWWLITFRPPAPKGTFLGGLCLVLAFILGISGFYQAAKGFPLCPGPIPGRYFLFGFAISYTALALVTTLALSRQLTSELLLITAWGLYEAMLINSLYGEGLLSRGGVLIMALIALLAVFNSLACYLAYYNLPYEKGYAVGCVPLCLALVVCAGQSFFLWRAGAAFF